MRPMKIETRLQIDKERKKGNVKIFICNNWKHWQFQSPKIISFQLKPLYRFISSFQ